MHARMHENRNLQVYVFAVEERVETEKQNCQKKIEYLLYNLDQALWLQTDHYQGGTCIQGDLFDCKGLVIRT